MKMKLAVLVIGTILGTSTSAQADKQCKAKCDARHELLMTMAVGFTKSCHQSAKDTNVGEALTKALNKCAAAHQESWARVADRTNKCVESC